MNAQETHPSQFAQVTSRRTGIHSKNLRGPRQCRAIDKERAAGEDGWAGLATLGEPACHDDGCGLAGFAVLGTLGGGLRLAGWVEWAELGWAEMIGHR